jgi:selenocysteine lyase/cysteine desulfurase
VVVDPATSRGAPWRSAIVSFRHAAEDPTVLCRRLDAAGIVVSLREDPQGRKSLRVAPHFYTSDAEIDALLGHL